MKPNAVFLGLVLASLLPGITTGQSLNLDLGPAPGSSAGVPSPGFGAAADTTGVWNDVTVRDTSSLVDLSGTPRGLAAHRGLPFLEVSDHPGTTGDVAALLDDRCTAATSSSLRVQRARAG